MLKKRIYIAGAMQGIDDENAPAFDVAQGCLRGLGFEVLSPVEIGRIQDDLELMSQLTDKQRATIFFDRDIAAIKSCDAIAMLVTPKSHWINSVGATAEFACAKWLMLMFFEIFVDGSMVLIKELDPTKYRFENSKE